MEIPYEITKNIEHEKLTDFDCTKDANLYLATIHLLKSYKKLLDSHYQTYTLLNTLLNVVIFFDHKTNNIDNVNISINKEDDVIIYNTAYNKIVYKGFNNYIPNIEEKLELEKLIKYIFRAKLNQHKKSTKDLLEFKI